MQYHLSRNNIVTGPYTKEALIKYGILPTDLIKEEGSTQWHAPQELADFKNFSSINAKPKFKITADKEVIEVKTDTTKKSEPLAELPANSPFKRVPSAVPKKKNLVENTEVADKTEIKKDIPKIPAKPIIANVEPVAKSEKTELKKSTKPTLIKKQRNENSTNAMKEIFAPLLILGGIGIAVWYGYKNFFSKSSFVNEPTVHAVSADSAAKVIPLEDTTAKEKMVVPKKHIIDSSAYYARRDSIHKAEKARRDSLALITASLKKDSIQSAKKNTPESTVVKKDIPTVTSAKKDAPAAITPAGKTIEKKPVAKKNKSIGDYVSVSVNKIPDKEVKGIKLNIKNVSDQPLNIAIIDVSYTNADGKIIRGETLQAENIGAGKTASVKVPNEKNATNISYKVSLISGDNVYLMGK